MSLILDALRKSEAERLRGQSPGLHSASSALRRERRWLPLAGTVAAIALVGGVSYWTLRAPAGQRNPVVNADVSDAASTNATGATAVLDAAKSAESLPPNGSLTTASLPDRESQPVVANDAMLMNPGFGGQANAGMQGQLQSAGGEWPAPQLVPPATAGAQPFAQAAESQPAPIPPAESVDSAAAQPVVSEAAPPMTTAAPAEILPEVTTSSGVPAPIVQQVSGLENPGMPTVGAPVALPDPSTLETSAEPALPSMYELDFATRRELPKLALTMHVFSKDPSKSFALVNGKRYVAGGEAIDGKVLVVEVLADGVICEFNGTRFLLPRQQ